MSKYACLLEDYPEDEYYISKMKDILEGYPKLGPLQHPSKLLEHLYIGNQDNADNLDLLQALEITHVLNVAGTRTFDLTRSPYRPNTGIIGFLMMPAEDYEEFDIMQYFTDAIAFLDKVKISGGRALVHCNIGVNRSGAIVAAYLMVHLKRPLLKVIEDLKSKRSLILQNEGFRRQLVRFARCRGLLDVPDRPPKKPAFILSTPRMNGNSRESTVAATNQERNENGKNVSNGTSNVDEEVTREPQEVAASKGTDSTDHFSKETPGEQGSEELEEKKASPSGSSGAVKNTSYENEHGNVEEKRETLSNKFSFLDVPGLRNDDDKSYSRISYLDLGSSRPRLSKEIDSYDFTSSKASSNYPSSGRQTEFSSRAIRDDLYDTKLSALSLEIPRSRFYPSISSQQAYSTLQHLNPTIRDYTPSFRVPYLDRAVPSALQRISRESSISDISNGVYNSLEDDDLTSKYSAIRSTLTPVSSGFFDGDSDYSTNSISSFSAKASNIPEVFVSTVKPRSYYQRLVTPGSSRHTYEDLDEENEFARITSSSGRRSYPKSVYNWGNGMLFTPHFAYNAPSAYPKRNSLSYEFLDEPVSYVSKNIYPKNIPYSRSSLSAIDSFSSYDFPQPLRNPYRANSNYRSTVEYDDAVDEYSDLLDASFGRLNSISAVTKCRSRTGTGSGFRRSYRY